MSRDFSTDIAIDKYNLTEELTRQPQLYYEWAKQAARASIDTTTAKDKLDLVRAEVELRVRKHPGLHDLPDKPTESMIRATVAVSRKVQSSHRDYLKTLRTEMLLKKAERSFEHRKKALEGLVSMNMQFYFANPKVTSNKQQRMDDHDLLEQHRSKRKIKRRQRYG